MRTIKVSEGQTLLDIAMQECGDVSAVYDIANLNGKSVTDDLQINEVLILPGIVTDEIVEMFKKKHRKPCSGEAIDESEVYGEGLEFWAIELDFVIS